MFVISPLTTGTRTGSGGGGSLECGAALWPSLRSRRGWRTTDSVPDPALTPGPRSGPQLLEPLEHGGVVPAGGWDPAGGPGAPSCPRLPARRWGAPEPAPRGEQFIPRDPSCPLAAARLPAHPRACPGAESAFISAVHTSHQLSAAVPSGGELGQGGEREMCLYLPLCPAPFPTPAGI